MTTIHNVPIQELADRVSHERTVWVRGAAVTSSDGWTLRLLDVVSRFPPPDWLTLRWRYPSVILFAERKAGRTVAGWIRKRWMRLGGAKILLDDLSDTCSSERGESGWSGYGRAALEWPTEVWNSSRRQNIANPYTQLVSDDAPAFISYEAAVANLLAVPLTGWSINAGEFLVRFQDTRARIARPHVSSAAVTFEIVGDQLRNAIVELAGDAPGQRRRLRTNRPRAMQFPLPDGLPPGAWLVVHRSGEWLDRRFIAEPYRRHGSDDVHYEVDALTELEALVTSGESPSVEYKEQLPGDDEGSKRNVTKTVGAFANGSGGRIVFGVDDDMVVVGLDPEDGGARACDRLANLVQNWVFPIPNYTVESLPAPAVEGRNVIVLTVEAGSRRPYGVGTDPTKATYYVRRGANSYAVGPEEVRAIAGAG